MRLGNDVGCGGFFFSLKSVMQMSGLVIACRSWSSLGAGFQATSALNPFLSLFLVCLVSSFHFYPY